MVNLLFIILIVWSFQAIRKKSNTIHCKYIAAFAFTLTLFFIDSLSVSFYAILVSDFCLDPDDGNSLILTFMVICSLCMILALVTLYAIFCLRLINVFKRSMFRLSNKMIKYLYFTCICQLFLASLAWLSYPITGGDTAAVAKVVSGLILYYIINSIILTLTFTKRLKHVSQTIRSLRSNKAKVAKSRSASINCSHNLTIDNCNYNNYNNNNNIIINDDNNNIRDIEIIDNSKIPTKFAVNNTSAQTEDSQTMTNKEEMVRSSTPSASGGDTGGDTGATRTGFANSISGISEPDTNGKTVSPRMTTNKLEQGSDDVIDNDNDNDNNKIESPRVYGEHGVRLPFVQQTMNLGSKIVLCVFFALLSSFLLSCVFVLIALMDSIYLSLTISWALMVDAIVNSLCLVLQWGFSRDLYNTMCKLCDKLSKRILF